MEKNIPDTFQLGSSHGEKDGGLGGVGDVCEYGSFGKIRHHSGKMVVDTEVGVENQGGKTLQAVRMAGSQGVSVGMVRFCR